MFCWHTEDLELYSINFLHFGKPKHWYCIPPAYTGQFERYCRFTFHSNYRLCSEFLRHKSSMVSPMILKNQGIPVNKVVQHAGEFIVIFARVYHSGFNSGFNCAEAVNFALPKWLEIGRKAGHFQCQQGSVVIDWEEFEQNLELPVKRKRSKG